MSLYSDVQQVIDEAAPQFWTQEQIYTNLNDAQNDTFTYLKGYALASTTLAISSGTDIVAWDTTALMLPTYCLNTLRNEVFITNHAQLQDYNPGWRNATPSATPTHLVLWDASHFRVWPLPSANIIYTLYGTPWAPELTVGVDGPTLDPFLHKTIVYRAASALLEFTQPELSDLYDMQAKEWERRYYRQLRNFGGANIFRLAPSKAWQVGQLGDINLSKRYW